MKRTIKTATITDELWRHKTRPGDPVPSAMPSVESGDFYPRSLDELGYPSDYFAALSSQISLLGLSAAKVELVPFMGPVSQLPCWSVDATGAYPIAMGTSDMSMITMCARGLSNSVYPLVNRPETRLFFGAAGFYSQYTNGRPAAAVHTLIKTTAGWKLSSNKMVSLEMEAAKTYTGLTAAVYTHSDSGKSNGGVIRNAFFSGFGRSATGTYNGLWASWDGFIEYAARIFVSGYLVIIRDTGFMVIGSGEARTADCAASAVGEGDQSHLVIPGWLDTIQWSRGKSMDSITPLRLSGFNGGIGPKMFVAHKNKVPFVAPDGCTWDDFIVTFPREAHTLPPNLLSDHDFYGGFFGLMNQQRKAFAYVDLDYSTFKPVAPPEGHIALSLMSGRILPAKFAHLPIHTELGEERQLISISGIFWDFCPNKIGGSPALHLFPFVFSYNVEPISSSNGSVHMGLFITGDELKAKFPFGDTGDWETNYGNLFNGVHRRAQILYPTLGVSSGDGDDHASLYPLIGPMVMEHFLFPTTEVCGALPPQLNEQTTKYVKVTT